MNVAQVRQALLELEPLEGVLAWYLLGSAARGALRPDSDLDLAALPMPGVTLDFWTLSRWAVQASVLFGREVDTGIAAPPHLVYAKEAVMTGVRVFCANEALANKRVSEILSSYMTFQDDRREVLDAYRAG